MGLIKDLFYILTEKSEGIEDRSEEAVVGGHFKPR